MRRCETCQKKTVSGHKCKVLKEMIGKDNDCWAWTDDPEWEEKVKDKVKYYVWLREGGKEE